MHPDSQSNLVTRSQLTSPEEMCQVLEAVLANAMAIRATVEELTEIRNPVSRRLALRSARRELDAYHRRLTITLWRARFDLVVQVTKCALRRVTRAPRRLETDATGRARTMDARQE